MEDDSLGVGALAISGFRAFLAASEGLGVVPMPFERHPWEQVADVLTSNDGTFTVKELGDYVRNLYYSALATPADEFPLETPEGAICWQAAGLHFFNLIQGGVGRNLRTAESAWADWAREQQKPSEDNKK